MRLVLTGGGTMGHVIPNVAVIEDLKIQCALKNEPLEILYIGSYLGPERRFIKNLSKKMSGIKLKFKAIQTGKLRRSFSFKNVIDAFRVPIGVMQAVFKIMTFRPQVVFSKGGYVSTPVCIAARVLKIPLVLHESDVTPGLSNKLFAKFAKTVCVSFEETKSYFNNSNVVVTGNPVRKEILKGDKKIAKEITHFDEGKPVLLVIGGSQGAEQINNLIRENLDELTGKFSIIHIAGRWKVIPKFRKKGYMQFEYVDEDLKHFYAISDFIISRGGANSLAEISALGIPSMIIPLSHIGRGDQIVNADVFAKNHPAVILENDDDFMDKISELVKLKPQLGVTELNAAHKIVKQLI